MKQHGSKLVLESQNQYTEQDAPEKFEQKIIEIYKELGNRNILIIFDEIENITFKISPSKHWARDMDFVFFWQTLRSLRGSGTCPRLRQAENWCRRAAQPSPYGASG